MEPVTATEPDTTAPREGVLPAAFPAWQAQLARHRAAFNASLARSRASGAPRDVLERALRELGPTVETLATTLPDDTLDEVCQALVDVVGDLAVRKFWHDRSAERHAIRTILPDLAGPLARSPRTTIDVVVQGAARIARGADLAAWGIRLGLAAEHLETDEDLRLGATVAAWRSGLVRARRAALAAASSLPDDALPLLLDLPEEGPHGHARAVLAANADDPFRWPSVPRSGLLARYGDFRGFGGAWVSPAVVVGTVPAATPTWALDADGARWLLLADAHGHAILRDPGAVSADASHTVDTSTLLATMPLLESQDEITGFSMAGRVVLLSRATSYRLDLAAPA